MKIRLVTTPASAAGAPAPAVEVVLGDDARRAFISNFRTSGRILTQENPLPRAEGLARFDRQNLRMGFTWQTDYTFSKREDALFFAAVHAWSSCRQGAFLLEDAGREVRFENAILESAEVVEDRNLTLVFAYTLAAGVPDVSALASLPEPLTT